MTEEPSAYAAAGVDIAAGERAVDLMRNWVETTRRSEVLTGLGADGAHGIGFALEDFGGAAKDALLKSLAAQLENATLGSEIAFKHADVVVRRSDRTLDGPNDILVAERVKRRGIGSAGPA